MISEALMGVMIGGLIGVVSQGIQIYSNKKDKMNDKKEQAYLRAIEILKRYSREINEPEDSEDFFVEDELKRELNTAEAYISLYGTDEIKMDFKKAINKILSFKKDSGASMEDMNLSIMLVESLIVVDLNK